MSFFSFSKDFEINWSEVMPDMVLVDVREDQELELEPSNVQNVLHMPLSDWDIGEIDARNSYAFFCRSGARSLKLVEFLRKQGYNKTFSIKGGLKARK